MAGTAISPPAAAAGGNVPPTPPYTPSFLNSFRIAAVAERLELHIRSPSKIDTNEFFNLCLSLARGLDYAAANNQIPNRVQELPILLKHVCKLNNDYLLRSAIMVLMISVKNACRSGWFRPADCEELLTLATEVGNSFCSVKDMNAEASTSQQTIAKVMSRYYPRMKIGQILVCLEAKPGYGALVIDFFIEKHSKTKEKICLFSVQTDNLETSSCIICPQQVSFLLNGKGVERKTNVFMDAGPQLPTVVTSMLKYGTNLLQAVGQFKGNFIIVVAFMSVVSNPERPTLQDCDPATIAGSSGSDSEVIEGPSRISLNCPISFTRIKTPVKGHLCKHLQCFDYDNFVDMNSRRPSWRCPHCNQSVCYLDIRVDQNLVKVLSEVDDNVTDVIISADGSWKPAAESSETKDQPHDKTPQDMDNVQANPHNVSIPQDICDLTEENDDMEIEAREEKPNLASLQTQSMNSTGEAHPNNLPHMGEQFWRGMLMSSYGSAGPSPSRPDAWNAGHNSGFDPTNSMLPPVLTDAVSPTTLTQVPEILRGSGSGQLQSPNGLPLQLSEVENNLNNFSNEYGRVPSTSSSRQFVTRTPVAVQALPAQDSTMTPSSRNGFNNSSATQGVSSHVFSLPSITDTASIITERQHQLMRSQLNNTPPISSMTPPSPTQHLTPQDNRPYMSSHQQMSGLSTPSHLRNSNRVPPTAVATEQQHSRLQQSQNFGMPQMRSRIPSNQISQGGGGTQHGVRQTGLPGHSQQLSAAAAAAQRAAQMTRQQPPVPIQTTRQQPLGNQRVNPQAAAATRIDGGTPNLPPEQNWRPTGRMRGALSGQAYSEALNQFIIQPTQQPAHAAAAARTTPNLASPPPGMPPHLQVLLANNRNTQIATPPAVSLPQSQPAPPQNHPGPLQSEPASTNGSSAVVPEASSAMRLG